MQAQKRGEAEAGAGALRGSNAHNNDFSRPEMDLKRLVPQKGQREAATRAGSSPAVQNTLVEGSVWPPRHSHRGKLKPQEPLGNTPSGVVYLWLSTRKYLRKRKQPVWGAFGADKHAGGLLGTRAPGSDLWPWAHTAGKNSGDTRQL